MAVNSCGVLRLFQRLDSTQLIKTFQASEETFEITSDREVAGELTESQPNFFLRLWRVFFAFVRLSQLKSWKFEYWAVKKKNLNSKGLNPFASISGRVNAFQSDLESFRPSIFKNWLCIQYFTHGLCLQKEYSDCAISFVWWIGIWSTHQVWISILSHKVARDIALHSICQPGKPRVFCSVSFREFLFSSVISSQRRAHSNIHSICLCSFAGENFQSAKSVLLFFPWSSTLAPSWSPSKCHSGNILP